MDSVALMAFGADFISTVMNQASFALQKSVHKDDEASMAAGDVKAKKSVFC